METPIEYCLRMTRQAAALLLDEVRRFEVTQDQPSLQKAIDKHNAYRKIGDDTLREYHEWLTKRLLEDPPHVLMDVVGGGLPRSFRIRQGTQWYMSKVSRGKKRSCFIRVNELFIGTGDEPCMSYSKLDSATEEEFYRKQKTVKSFQRYLNAWQYDDTPKAKEATP